MKSVVCFGYFSGESSFGKVK